MIEGERAHGAHMLPTSRGHRNHPSRVEARGKSRPGSSAPGGFNLGLDVTGGKQQGGFAGKNRFWSHDWVWVEKAQKLLNVN